MVSPARIVRAGNWWASKIPPLIGLALVCAVLFEVGFERTAEVILAVILVTGGAVGAYGHLLNDLFDLEADRLAGRRNRLAGVAAPIRILMVAGALVVAFLPAAFIPYGRVVLGLLVLECVLPAVYSIPPLRLKDRGAWGVAADAGGAHVVPTLIVLAAAVGPRIVEHPVAMTCAVVWSAAVGLEGILWHQLRDREDDHAAGVATLAVRTSPEVLRRTLVVVLHPLKAIALIALVVALQPLAPLVAVALAGVAVLDAAKWALGWRFVYAPGDPLLERANLPLVSNAFGEFWFPMMLAVDAAAMDRRFLLVTGGVALVFHRGLVSQLREASALFRDLVVRSARADAPDMADPSPEQLKREPADGWRVECHEGAAAELSVIGPRHLTIRDAGTIEWHLKLTRPIPPLVGGAEYELRCEIAADRDREVTICVVRDVEPWDNLGLSERLAVGTSTRSLWLRFRSDTDAGAKLDFLLGGTPVDVTVAEATLERRYDPVRGEGS